MHSHRPQHQFIVLNLANNMEIFSEIKLILVFLYFVTQISAQSHDVSMGNCTNTEPVFSQVIHKKNTGYWWFSKEEYAFKYNGVSVNW